MPRPLPPVEATSGAGEQAVEVAGEGGRCPARTPPLAAAWHPEDLLSRAPECRKARQPLDFFSAGTCRGSGASFVFEERAEGFGPITRRGRDVRLAEGLMRTQ